MLDYLKAYSRVLYLSCPAIYYSLKRIRKGGQHLCRKDTDLCLEGYPSSANSFGFNVLEMLCPQVNIAHHSHAVAGLKVALQNNVPTVIIVRNPADAVASRLARFSDNMTVCLVEYVSFYRFVRDHSADLTVVTFEELTERTFSAVKAISKGTGIDFRPPPAWTHDDLRRAVFCSTTIRITH